MAELFLIQKQFRGYAGRAKVKILLVHSIHSDLKRLAGAGPLKNILDIDCLSDYHSQLLLQCLITIVTTTDYRLYKSLPVIALLKEYRNRLTVLINIKENHDCITKYEYKNLYEDRKCMINEDKRSLLLVKIMKMKEKNMAEANKKAKQKAEIEKNEQIRMLKRKATKNIMYYLSDEQSHEKQERELMFGEETKARKYYSFLQSSGNAKYLLDCELMRQEDLSAKILRHIDIEKKQEMELLKSSELKVNKLFSRGASPKASPKCNQAYWKRMETIVPLRDLVNSSVRLTSVDSAEHYTCAHYTLSHSKRNEHPAIAEYSNSNSVIKFNLNKFLHRELVHTLLMARYCRVMAYHTMSLALGAFKTHYNCLIKLRNELCSIKISTRQKRKEYIAAAVRNEAALVANRRELIVCSELLYDMVRLEVQLFTEVFASRTNFLDSSELNDITEYKSSIGIKYGSAATAVKGQGKPASNYSDTSISAGSDMFWSINRYFSGPYPPPAPTKKANHTPDDRCYDDESVKVTSTVDDASVSSEGNTTVVSDGSVSSMSANKTNKKYKRNKKISREERSKLAKEAMQKTMEVLAIKERKHFDVPGFRVFLSKKTVVTQFDFIQWGNEIAKWMTSVSDWFAAAEQKWKVVNKTAIISSIQRLKYLSNIYPLGVIDTDDIDSLLLYSDSSSLHLHELLMYTLDIEVNYEQLNTAGKSNYSCVFTSSFLDRYYGKHPSSCLVKYLMDDFAQLFYSNNYSVEEANVLDRRSQLVQNRLLISLKLTDLEAINKNKSIKLPYSSDPLPPLSRLLSLTRDIYKVEKDEIMLLLQCASARNTLCTVDLVNVKSSTPLLLLAQGRHCMTPSTSVQVHRASSGEVTYRIPLWCFPLSRWDSRLDIAKHHCERTAIASRMELICDKYGKILLLKLKLRVLIRRTLCAEKQRDIERDMMSHEDALAHVTSGRLVINPGKKKGLLHNFANLLLSKQRRARIAIMDEYTHILTKRPWPAQRIDYGSIYRMSIDVHKCKSNFIVDLPEMQNKLTTLFINVLANELQLMYDQRVKGRDWIVKKSHYTPILSDVAVGGGILTTLVLVRVFEQADQSSNLVQDLKIEVCNDASGDDQVVVDARLGYLLSRRLCDNNKGINATKCVVNKNNRNLSDQAYATIYDRNPAKSTDKAVALPTVMDMKILFWKRFRHLRWGAGSREKNNKIIIIQSVWRRKIVMSRFQRANNQKHH